jgi:hypothetical protein
VSYALQLDFYHGKPNFQQLKREAYSRNFQSIRTAVVSFAVCALLFVVAWPPISEQLTATLKVNAVPSGISAVNSFIIHGKNGNSLWFPNFPSFALSGLPTHPTVAASNMTITQPISSWLNSKSTFFTTLRNSQISQVVESTNCSDYQGSEFNCQMVNSALTTYFGPHANLTSSGYKVFTVSRSNSYPFMTTPVAAESKVDTSKEFETVSSIKFNSTGSEILFNSKSHKKPYLLLFAQKYDEHWSAEINGITLTHLQVHGWENGFIIPSNNHRESILLKYSSQSAVNLGATIVLTAISAITFINLSAVLAKRNLRKLDLN